MIAKNQQFIERTVYRLSAILETDRLSSDEEDSILMALDALSPWVRENVEDTYLADHSQF